MIRSTLSVHRCHSSLASPFLLLLLFACGCDLSNIDRVNHLHSDSNQKLAQKALDSFEGFANEQTGLEPTLLKNLNAQSAHAGQLNDLRISLDEGDLATSLTDTTWNRLRSNLYWGLGLTEGETGEDAATFVRWQRRLDRRVENRQRKVQAVGSVLQALALGQEAMILTSKANVERTTRQLESQKIPASQPERVQKATTQKTDDDAAKLQAQELAGFLFRFREAVIAAGEQSLKTQASRQEALTLQREILASIAKSRDKSSAMALVALVGSGLSRDSSRRLDEFIAYLATRLKDLEVLSAQGNSADAQAWKKFSQAAENAKALIAAASMLDDLDEARRQVAANPQLPSTALKRAVDKSVKTYLVDEGDVNKSNAESLSALDTQLWKWFTGKNELAVLSDSLPDIGSEISRYIDEFRALIDQLPSPLLDKDLQDLLAAAKSLDKDAAFGTLRDAALKYLEKTIASNPALIDRIKTIQSDPKSKEKFDADLAHLGSILKDINDQAAQATNRVLEFIRDLYRLQLDLDQENLRHYRSLSAIASEELKRWQLLSGLNQRYRYYYADVRKALQQEDRQALIDRARAIGGNPSTQPAAQPTRVSFTLFADDGTNPDTDWNGTGNAKLEAPKAHPVIATSQPILPSLRSLAETAREWQYGSPSKDTDGRNTTGSHYRLFNAIELINGHVLMLSLNERFSLENALTLNTEVQEHDLHLDAIAVRTREAGLRLGLRDLLAYHATGITEADIQAAIGVVQQVLLARIGSKL